MYGLWLFKEIKTEYGNCKVELYRKGYTASAVEIGGFVGNSLNLALENLDTITAPIGKSVCSFSIYDTEQVEYDDLFTPDATAYKVVVSTKVDGGEYSTRWSGYVTPDFFAENLSFRTPISISARDNIGYLNDVDFDLDAATITVRELIQAAFNRIAEDYPMSLSFVTQKQTAEGILAIDATISTYLLREMSWYEALETILHDLGLQMRWVDNNTIAVLDISQLGENFGLQRFNFVERSGYREILPAWRELSQKQDYGLRENFFEGKMTTKELAFAKTQSLTVPDLGFRQDVRYYKPTNWGVARDIYTTDPSFYNSTFGNRLIFSAVSETYPDTTYLSWSTNVLKSNVPLTVKCKALNSIIYPSGGVTPYPLQLKVYDPFLALGSREGDYLQIGLRMNLFLHTRDNKTYVMNKEWVEDNGTGSGTYINMTLDKVSLDAYNVIEGKGAFPIGSQPQEQELTITANTIPYDGALELRIYGYYVVSYQYADENIQSPNFDKFFTYIDDLTYTFDGNDISSGQESKVQISELHNIKEDRGYSFGQVPLDCGGINAYAGGLFKTNGDELVGFKRNADSTTYPLLELVGREIIHFNKKNYNKLSGTIKNLAKEPLRFDKVFIYKGKNYLPFAYSLDVISNTMNITTMQEVEPYMTYSFVEIKSELVTGGGATISGGNNTALQYSAEVGNAKRISELNNASESEKKESYIVIDNANWNESKKVPLSEMEGLDEAQVAAYLTENKYAKQSWVKGITDDLETDIAKRVLIEDFDKLQEAVDLNYANLNKATTRISTLEGYFSNGVANNAAKLGGQLPSYYATKSALDTTNTNLSNLSTTVGTIAGNLSNLTGRVSTAEEIIKGHTSSINKAVADIAANAKNISTNATNITAVANRVKTLEDLGFTLKDGYIYTEKTIVSKGEIISGRRASGTSTDVGGGGGISSITAQMIADALGYVPYSSANPAGYINSSALNGYAKLTDIPSLSGYAKLTDIPSLSGYATEQYVTSRGYITGITSAMVTTALGYTPYNSANFTKANIKSTLGIADWALAASKPSYSWSEITGKPSFATVATSGKYSDLSGVPTSLPASDVYAWAKKSSLALADVPDLSSKYAAVGLTGSSSYVALKNGGYIAYSGGDKWSVTNSDWTAVYGILHEANYTNYTYSQSTIDSKLANYLPLTGGTISGDIVWNKGKWGVDTSARGVFMSWNDSNYLHITSDGAFYNWNKLIHAGNYADTTDKRYLQLSGGTMKSVYFSPLSVDRDSDSGAAAIGFTRKSALLGFLGFNDTTGPKWLDSAFAEYFLIHSGNIGSQSVSYATKSFALVNNSTEQKSVAYVSGNTFYIGDSIYATTSTQILGKDVRLRYGATATFGLILNESGNVLIGTTADNGAKLQVNGGSRVYLNEQNVSSVMAYDTLKTFSLLFADNNRFGLNVWLNSNGSVSFQSSYHNQFEQIFNLNLNPLGGNVLVGTATDNGSGAKLQVSGNLTATGEVISSRRASSSDRRLKDNITYLDTTECLAMVRHIRPAEWDWKDNGKHSLGFIAQDVEHLMPYAVTSIKDDILGQKLNLQYDQFIALAIGGVQAVDNEVVRLKARVEYLENKIKEYEYGNYRN